MLAHLVPQVLRAVPAAGTGDAQMRLEARQERAERAQRSGSTRVAQKLRPPVRAEKRQSLRRPVHCCVQCGARDREKRDRGVKPIVPPPRRCRRSNVSHAEGCKQEECGTDRDPAPRNPPGETYRGIDMAQVHDVAHAARARRAHRKKEVVDQRQLQRRSPPVAGKHDARVDHARRFQGRNVAFVRLQEDVFVTGHADNHPPIRFTLHGVHASADYVKGRWRGVPLHISRCPRRAPGDGRPRCRSRLNCGLRHTCRGQLRQ
jgi:hypothetical protein